MRVEKNLRSYPRSPNGCKSQVSWWPSKITSSVHVNMDGRTPWPKSSGVQGKSTHRQAESCSYMRDSKCRERVSWIFCCFLIFLTGVRNSRWMKNALISYYTTWYANSLTFALIGAHQLTITARTSCWRLHLQFLLLQLFADGYDRGNNQLHLGLCCQQLLVLPSEDYHQSTKSNSCCKPSST